MKSENEMELTGTQPVSESESEPKAEIRHKKTADTSHSEKNQPKKHKKKKISQKERRQRSARVYGVLIMLTFVFVISISLAVGIIEVGKDMLGINGSQRLVLFNIPEGATTAEIAQDLYEDGIIRIPKAFIYFSKLSKDDVNFVAGNHEISASMAYETLIAELSKSMADDDSQAVVDVMFPEGITLYDAAMKLQENNVCEASKFLYYFNAGNLGYEFEDHLPATNSTLKFYRMEGYCFPDTYTFYEESEPDDVCRKIYMNFNLKIKDEYYDRMEELGISLVWERADEYKASWLCYHLRDVSITNEADWPRMAKFHAEWSDKICNAVLPYLQNEDDASARLTDIAGILRQWTVEQDAVNENLAKCNRTYTRFTTNGMSEILPDIPNGRSVIIGSDKTQ